MTPFAKEATLSNCTRDKERAIEYQETSSKEGCRGKIFEEKEGQESQQDPERVSRHWSNNIKLCQECWCWAYSWRKRPHLRSQSVKCRRNQLLEGIKEHLEMLYGRNFGYGTVVELCVARNKRRKVSTRYIGLARVTCRRARKGFTLRYSPDQLWSAAF